MVLVIAMTVTTIGLYVSLLSIFAPSDIFFPISVEQQNRKYSNMLQKFSGKSAKSDLDNTKITSIINYRGGDLADVTRIYRKEEMLKKKLRMLLDGNATLEKQIKNHQTEIKDQRASVQFQLNDLLKEMSLKFGHFTEEKLEISQFNSNEAAHRSIQAMMQKYEQIEKECQMMTRMFESIQKIQSNYQQHGRQMDDMVIDSQASSKEYQDAMEESLYRIKQQIKRKTNENEDIEQRTQDLIKGIDTFIAGVEEMKEDEQKIMGKIDKLKKMATCQQEKVDEIKEWAEIIIDKSNRKAVYKTIKQKLRCLDIQKQKNNQLQIYLCELTNQEERLKREKENMEIRIKSASKSKKNIGIMGNRSNLKSKRNEI